MSNFSKNVNWNKFWWYVKACPIVLFIIGVCFGTPNMKWLWSIPLITLLWSLMLLLSAHSQYILRRKPELKKKIEQWKQKRPGSSN